MRNLDFKPEENERKKKDEILKWIFKYIFLWWWCECIRFVRLNTWSMCQNYSSKKGFAIYSECIPSAIFRHCTRWICYFRVLLLRHPRCYVENQVHFLRMSQTGIFYSRIATTFLVRQLLASLRFEWKIKFSSKQKIMKLTCFYLSSRYRHTQAQTHGQHSYHKKVLEFHHTIDRTKHKIQKNYCIKSSSR